MEELRGHEKKVSRTRRRVAHGWRVGGGGAVGGRSRGCGSRRAVGGMGWGLGGQRQVHGRTGQG